MAKDKPDTVATTNDKINSCVDCKAPALRKVTYVFVISSGNVAMPYALAQGGVVLAEFKDAARSVSGTRGRISCTVASGTKVNLFLNSDAHPNHRKNAVYEITPTNNDVVVTITEKSQGKYTDSDTPVFKETKEDPKTKIKTDHYSAPLTGDIWMKITHRYTTEEADRLLPSDTDAGIRAAVKSIYEPLTSRELTVTLDNEATVTVVFNDSENPKNNITSYDLLKDGLTRVHPLGYLAMLSAAKDAQLKKLTMTSAWRPRLGSIAHRAGLGLDVGYIEDAATKTVLNRQELKGGGSDTTNVSDEEKKLFEAYEQKKKENSEAKEKQLELEKKLRKAKKDSDEWLELTEAHETAKKKAEAAAKEQSKAEIAWNNERDKNEPNSMRAFRRYLAQCSCVRQLFDPWFMDGNTQDENPAEANKQTNKNEELHAHHLHITVHEPKIIAK